MMDSDHCRKATEFWDAAETSRDNLADRLAWPKSGVLCLTDWAKPPAKVL